MADIRRLTWSDAHLADIPLPTAVMRLSRSLASGLCRCPADPPDIFWGVGDRGPNIKPSVAAERYGIALPDTLLALEGAKLMPLPDVGPAIARFRIDGDAIVQEALIELTDAGGRAVSGLPIPHGTHAEHEPVFDLSGRPLPCHPGGIDSEGIAALADGSFWIAEEYGPSLLHIDRSGRVIQRWVPAGMGPACAGAGYPVTEALPALAAARKLNRGFEAIAASPDGARLTIAFQSPLAHPDRNAHDGSAHVRIWEIDGQTGALLAEHIYPLDDPASFRRDAAAGPVRRNDVKVSEMLCLDDGGLLILERITHSTKIYHVRIGPDTAVPPELSRPQTRPTIEQMNGSELARSAIRVLQKRLILSTDDHPAIGGDLEGMILLSSDELLLSSDSDFGIEGAETGFWRVRLAAPPGATG